MTFNINWTFFLNVGSVPKSQRIVDKINNLMEWPLVDIKIERYWKDKTLYKVSAKSSFEAATARDAFYNTMHSANVIARTWTINGPSHDASWEFGGVASPGSCQISGVDSASFSASTVGTFRSAATAV